MLTTVETPLVYPSSLACEEIDHSVYARRHELTDLILSEKNYFLRIALSILRNEADAEDVVHSSFCAAWKGVAAFRGESSMKTWFSRIVSNHAIVALKKMRRGKVVSLEDDPAYLQCFEQNSSSEVEDPEKSMLRREALRLVGKHIEDLPRETRIVVRLYLSTNGSIAKIAELRGKSRLSITAHLHRGKVLLRKSVRKAAVRRSRFTLPR